MNSLILLDDYLKDLVDRLSGVILTEKTQPRKMEFPEKYEYRALSWYKDDLNFLVEIFPTSKDGNSQLNEWNFSYCIHFDEDNQRFLHRSSVIEDGPKRAIIENIQDLFDHSFKMMRDFCKENREAFEKVKPIKG